MARSSKTVHPKIYQWLYDVFRKDFGESPTVLIQGLNQRYPDARKAASANNPHKKKDLISDRTIQNFFREDSEKKLSLLNLNYLCQMLLGGDYDALKEMLANDPDDVISLRNIDGFSYAPQRQTPRKIDDVLQLTEIKSVKQMPPLNDWLPAYQKVMASRYGLVRIPAMREEKPLDSLYVAIGLSKDLKIRKKKNMQQLLAELENPAQDVQNILSAEDIFSEHDRIMIWGQAGTGKTTLLKNRVCNPNLSKNKIPVFIALADYSRLLESDGADLTEALIREFQQTLSHASRKHPELNSDAVLAYLEQGLFFIVLDGLDEVPTKSLGGVEDNIADLVKQYPHNKYVLACRFGTTDYVPDKFIEVEIAKWELKAIDEFIHKWFRVSTKSEDVDQFLEDFKASKVAGDIAKTPLLLTLLCQLYEDGYDLPTNEHELIEDAIELYLRKWDSARRVKRDPEFEEKLSRQRRRDLFAEIAYRGMIEGRRVWRRWELEALIEDCLVKTQNFTQETLQADIGNVIYLLETHHGLLVKNSSDTYVFSHRSFQEYFTAMQVMSNYGQDTQAISNFINQYLLDRQFKEVIVLTLSRQKDVEPFLREIREGMEALLKRHPILINWLQWLVQVTTKAGVSSTSWRVAVTSFDLETKLYYNSRPEVDRSMTQRLAERLRQFNKRNPEYFLPTTPRIRLIARLAAIQDIAADRAKGVDDLKFDKLGMFFASVYEDLPNRLKAVFTDLMPIAQEVGIAQLTEIMVDLLEKFPAEDADAGVWENWAQRLQTAMQQHLEVGYDHPIDSKDAQALEDYIYLASLIADVVLGDSQCSAQFRREIIESLFLPPTA